MENFPKGDLLNEVQALNARKQRAKNCFPWNCKLAYLDVKWQYTYTKDKVENIGAINWSGSHFPFSFTFFMGVFPLCAHNK